MTPEHPIRVGALVSSEYIPVWKTRALNNLLDRTHAELTHVVVNKSDDASSDGLRAFLQACVSRLREYPLWSVVGIGRLLSPEPSYERRVSIGTIDGISEATIIWCRPEPADGLGNTLPDAVVEEVGENTDVVVRFGFGVLKGDILTRPTYGVLSYHFGDIRKYRGQVGGFWEFLAGEPTAGVTLQRLTETLDGGAIAAYGAVNIQDAETWQAVRRRQVAIAEDLLAPGVRNLVDPSVSVSEPETLGELRSIPTGTTVLRYLVRTGRGYL